MLFSIVNQSNIQLPTLQTDYFISFPYLSFDEADENLSAKGFMKYVYRSN